jgi:ABC-type transport system involved in cytochrome c biogenesis permease subunit
VHAPGQCLRTETAAQYDSVAATHYEGQQKLNQHVGPCMLHTSLLILTIVFGDLYIVVLHLDHRARRVLGEV